MRCIRTIVFVCLFIEVGGPVIAAERPTSGLAISGHLGVFNPIGDFAKKGSTIIDEPAGSAKTGISPHVMVEYFVMRNVSIGAKFGYIWFGQDPGWLQRLVSGIDVDGQWRVHEYGVFVRTIINPRARTSFFGRVGIFSGKLQNITDLHAPGGRYAEVKIKAESATGYEFGLGINEMLSRKLAFFGELCYTRLNCKGKAATLTFLGDQIDGTLRLDATWVGLRAGLAFFPF